MSRLIDLNTQITTNSDNTIKHPNYDNHINYYWSAISIETLTCDLEYITWGCFGI